MSKARKMNNSEREIYNEAQDLYRRAQAKRDEAVLIYEKRLKEKSEEAKLNAEKLKQSKLEGERQEFSNRINRICLTLGSAVKKEFLQIDGGVMPLPCWNTQTVSEKKIFTLQNYSFPRMTADVYAVAGKGFRWDIKMA